MYYELLIGGKLNDHLADTEDHAQGMMWTLTRQMAKAEGGNEDVKRRDKMAWVGTMNNISSRVTELIRLELICR